MLRASVRVLLSRGAVLTLILAPALACSQAQVATTQTWAQELHPEASYAGSRLIGGTPDSRPWTQTADGGYLLALNSSLDGGGELLLRFAADGSLLARRTIPRASVTGKVELLPNATGGAWMLRSGELGSEAIALSTGLEVTQRFSLTGYADAAVTSDNGLLVLGTFGLERYDGSSTATWRIDADADTQFYRLLARPEGGWWIAAQRRDADGAQAGLLRYGADRTLLGATWPPCPGCPVSEPLAFAAHPDGGAIMSGISPSFLARFQADGSALWVTSGDGSVDADAMSVGTDGDIVLRHRDGGRFSGFSSQTGYLQWTVDALYAIPDGTGALIIVAPAYASDQPYLLRSIDASGTTRWERSLDAPGLQEISYPAAVPDGIRFLAWYDYVEAPAAGCPAQPSVLHATREGNLGIGAQVCSVPTPAWASVARITERGNALVRVYGGIESYAEDGRRRWRYEPCPDCDAPIRLSERYSAHPVAATADGGAWTMESSVAPGSIYPSAFRLRRISSRGDVERSVDLSDLPHFALSTRLLVGSNDAAMLFWASNTMDWNQVGWLRVDADGVTTGSIQVTTVNQWISLFSARLLEDGDAIVAFTPDNSGGLRPNPYPRPILTSLLRLSPSGGVRWRHDVPIDDAQAVGISESGATAVGRSGAPFRIQYVGAQGLADPFFDVMPFDTYGQLMLLAPQDTDTILVVSLDGLRRVHRSGNTVHSRGWSLAGPWGATVSPLGLLVPNFSDAQGNAATLFGADDLKIRMVANLDLGTPPGEYYSGAVAGGDGIVMMVQSRENSDGTKSTFLAQFAVPGTTAAGRVMRDSFEP